MGFGVGFTTGSLAVYKFVRNLSVDVVWGICGYPIGYLGVGNGIKCHILR